MILHDPNEKPLRLLRRAGMRDVDEESIGGVLFTVEQAKELQGLAKVLDRVETLQKIAQEVADLSAKYAEKEKESKE